MLTRHTRHAIYVIYLLLSIVFGSEYCEAQTIRKLVLPKSQRKGLKDILSRFQKSTPAIGGPEHHWDKSVSELPRLQLDGSRDPSSGTHFGQLHFSGLNWIIASDPGISTNASHRPGCVQLFGRTPSDEKASWYEVQRLTMPGGAGSGDGFGRAVAVSNDTLAVAALPADTHQPATLSLFQLSPATGRWSHSTNLYPPPLSQMHLKGHLGCGVALWGRYVVTTVGWCDMRHGTSVHGLYVWKRHSIASTSSPGSVLDWRAAVAEEAGLGAGGWSLDQVITIGEGPRLGSHRLEMTDSYLFVGDAAGGGAIRTFRRTCPSNDCFSHTATYWTEAPSAWEHPPSLLHCAPDAPAYALLDDPRPPNEICNTVSMPIPPGDAQNGPGPAEDSPALEASFALDLGGAAGSPKHPPEAPTRVAVPDTPASSSQSFHMQPLAMTERLMAVLATPGTAAAASSEVAGDPQAPIGAEVWVYWLEQGLGQLAGPRRWIQSLFRVSEKGKGKHGAKPLSGQQGGPRTQWALLAVLHVGAAPGQAGRSNASGELGSDGGVQVAISGPSVALTGGSWDGVHVYDVCEEAKSKIVQFEPLPQLSWAAFLEFCERQDVATSAHAQAGYAISYGGLTAAVPARAPKWYEEGARLPPAPVMAGLAAAGAILALLLHLAAYSLQRHMSRCEDILLTLSPGRQESPLIRSVEMWDSSSAGSSPRQAAPSVPTDEAPAALGRLADRTQDGGEGRGNDDDNDDEGVVLLRMPPHVRPAPEPAPASRDANPARARGGGEDGGDDGGDDDSRGHLLLAVPPQGGPDPDPETTPASRDPNPAPRSAPLRDVMSNFRRMR